MPPLYLRKAGFLSRKWGPPQGSAFMQKTCHDLLSAVSHNPNTLDPTAGIETRSTMLRASIEAALAGDGLKPNEPIHIIAHSMGGLDSRRLISKGNFIETNGRRTPIQTLATIGTPHRGSPVADLVALKF